MGDLTLNTSNMYGWSYLKSIEHYNLPEKYEIQINYFVFGKNKLIPHSVQAYGTNRQHIVLIIIYDSVHWLKVDIMLYK